MGRFQSKLLAVSGPRRLAAVVSILITHPGMSNWFLLYKVSTGGKRILLFDVDVEEEDDDLNTEEED